MVICRPGVWLIRQKDKSNKILSFRSELFSLALLENAMMLKKDDRRNLSGLRKEGLQR